MRDLYNPYRTSEPCNPLAGIGPAVELFGTTLVPSLRPLGPSLPAGFHAQLRSETLRRANPHPFQRVIVGILVGGMALALWIGKAAESVQAETPGGWAHMRGGVDSHSPRPPHECPSDSNSRQLGLGSAGGL